MLNENTAPEVDCPTVIAEEAIENNGSDIEVFEKVVAATSNMTLRDRFRALDALADSDQTEMTPHEIRLMKNSMLRHEIAVVASRRSVRRLY